MSLLKLPSPPIFPPFQVFFHFKDSPQIAKPTMFCLKMSQLLFCFFLVETNVKEERINGDKNKPENIMWHESSICRCDRQQLLQQKGCVIWITGLSGSGKSTVACALSKALFERGKLTYTLDGDNVRHGLNRDLTFKAEDRTENIRRIGTIIFQFCFKKITNN